ALQRCATAVDRGSPARLATRLVTSTSLDIVAIGGAIVYVLATCDGAVLSQRGFAKGSMRLLTVEEARDLYAAMGPGREISGGSAAKRTARAGRAGPRTP